MTYTTDKPVFVIGDVHGHLDRLEALLLQEGIIDSCPDCNGTGDEIEHKTDYDPNQPPFCERCNGDGLARVRDDCVVIQLGDLGHFGSSWSGPPRGGHSVPGSQMGDLMTYEHGCRWLDYVLWGNHDRAVIDNNHIFSGYIEPTVETFRVMQKLRDEGRMILSYAAHGFLLTHAGLHKQFKFNESPSEAKIDPVAFADWCNANLDLNNNGIVDAISHSRGGRSNHGGILWRDASESLFPGFRQIFGHSSKPKVRRYENEAGWSFCIDVGDKDNGRLVGIWLPDEKVVEVTLTSHSKSTKIDT